MAVVGLVIVAASCKRKDDAAADAAPRVDAGVTPAVAAGPQGSDLRALLCGTRGAARCRVANEIAAGNDAAGAARIAASIVIADPPDDAGLDEYADDGEDVETWLVRKRGGVFTRVQLLVQRRVRPRGGPWNDEAVKLKDGVLHFDLGGNDVPSTWKGSEAVEIGLEPPRVLRKTGSYYNAFQPCPTSNDETSAGGFVRTTRWRGPASCEGPQPPCTDTFEYLAVPRVKLPPAFEADGWKSTDLDACATVVDGTSPPARGFVTFGKSGGAADAEMRLVLSDTRVLYVEVRDDHFTEAIRPGNWAKADHLELWSTRTAASYMMACSTDKPTQWGVSVFAPEAGPELGVFLGVRGTDEGHPDARPLPIVQRAVTGAVARFQIRLPPWGAKEESLEGLTVAYSDSDDGKTQKSILATSKLVFGRHATLGRIEGASATCDVVAGKLRARHPGAPDKVLDQ